MNKEQNVLIIVKYGKNEIFQVRHLVESNNAEYAVYPLGTKFDKDMLKEYRGKVIKAKIIWD